MTANILIVVDYTLKMDAARSSETLVTAYRATLSHNSAERNLNSHLKSHTRRYVASIIPRVFNDVNSTD